MIKNSKNTTIAELFGGLKNYSVPAYQRSFSWEKEQVERFWDDLLEITQNKARKDYFLGAMIFKETEQEQRIEVIDGQQRLAMVTILFACIRDMYDGENNNFPINRTAGSGIEADYIGKESRISQKWEYRLTLNKIDQIFFSQYVQSRNPTPWQKKSKFSQTSHKLIYNARQQIYGKIKECTKTFDARGKEEFLRDLEESLANKFKIIATYVDDDVDAYTIFETLNDRGLDLSIADLLKNYFYSRAQNNFDAVQLCWEQITNLLDGRDLKDFLRHYWLSSRGLVREKNLYRFFKSDLKEQRDVYSFLAELLKEAETYSALLSPDDSYWENSGIVDLLEVINILDAKLVRPLLLSGRHVLGVKDFEKLIRMCVDLTFRYSTICNQNPNKLERVYSSLAIQLREGAIGIGGVKREFGTLNPSNETFITAFEEKEVKNSELARYILSILNDHVMGKEEIGVYQNVYKVNLEHIMPKKLDKEWEHYVKKAGIKHKDFLNRIGNLTLLSKNKNVKASNKSFEEKCDIIYSNSELPITYKLLEYKEWNEDSIKNRQKYLAEKAIEVWKI